MMKIHERYPEENLERGGGGGGNEGLDKKEIDQLKIELGELGGLDIKLLSELGHDDMFLYKRYLAGKLDFVDLETYKMKMYNEVLEKEKRGEQVNVLDEPKNEYFNWLVNRWNEQQEEKRAKKQKRDTGGGSE